jgi:hypothetical protein
VTLSRTSVDLIPLEVHSYEYPDTSDLSEYVSIGNVTRIRMRKGRAR